MEGRIACPVDSNPPATVVTWTRNEHKLQPEINNRIRVTREGTLVIKSVDIEDEGHYACTPSSPIGPGRTSSVVQVFVKGKIIIILNFLKIPCPPCLILLSSLYLNVFST